MWWMFYYGGDSVALPPLQPKAQPQQGQQAQLKGQRMRPGLAMSQDGRNWARIEGEHHSGALLDVGPPGSWDASYVARPQACGWTAYLPDPGSRPLLPCLIVDLLAPPCRLAIERPCPFPGRWFSTGPTTCACTSPRLMPPPASTWCAVRPGPPSSCRHFFLYSCTPRADPSFRPYPSSSPRLALGLSIARSSHIQVGLARSQDGFRWVKPPAGSPPIFSGGPAGSFDECGAFSVNVVRER